MNRAITRIAELIFAFVTRSTGELQLALAAKRDLVIGVFDMIRVETASAKVFAGRCARSARDRCWSCPLLGSTIE